MSDGTRNVETEGNPFSNDNNPTEEKVEFASVIDGEPEVNKKDNGVVWSDWIVATPCSDTCGACGMTHLIRECLCVGEEGCPCSEREFRVEVCAKKLCTFPRRSCCEGFKKTATAKALQCEPIDESIEQKIIEKESLVASKKFIEAKTEEDNEVSEDEVTVWGEWTVDTPCTDTCGSCGNTNLVRECLCQGREGCPCSERETRVEVCGTGLCEFPRKTCCEGYKKISTPKGFKCAPKEIENKKRIEEATEKKESLIHSRPNPRSVHLKKKEVTNSDAPKQRAAKTHRIDPISFNIVEGSPWSEWIVSINCTDTCGACGTITYTRSCLCAGEEDCPCSHRQTRTDSCGIGLCSFPRHTCCAPAKKTLTPNGFQCLTEETIQPSDNVIVSNPSLPLSPDYISASSRNLFEKNDSDSINNIPELTATPSQKEHLAVWGQWIVNTPCTDTCGSCGRIHLTRECLCAGEEGCPCSQRESRVEVCGTELCGFPRHTCCKGFIKIPTPDGFRCAAEKESDERICTGQFTPWVEVESVNECPVKCGMCGKRKVATRKCEPDHCECSGETELFESCGHHPCREGKECCDGYVKGRVDGREECVPNASIPPSLSVASRKFLDRKKADEKKEMEGRKVQLMQILPVLDSPSNCTWGEWTEIESECSGSCGMCGVRISARRNCFPVGCNCVGPSTRYEDCGEGICEDREKPCCGYYTPSTINGISTCVDPVGVVQGKTSTKRTEVKKTQRQRDTLSTSTCRGIWSPFIASPSSHCDSPCGLCGHRSVAERECIPHGCTCEGSNKLYERCGEKPCWNKKEGCCEGASIVLVDGKRICKEIN
ncbi:hypothetical protein PRIPAC_71426 [Pristionchus pacificus]|uniref:Uncharacterized protein n=1 Tax=Pristionchus pacificus TaxID=54126 RepID=A0A2A6CQP6_PRIPA|nr:hypothetical protein PRIPAC_71426 [Pristionchus pacificus]|eukprot:PDM80544.1 hypothetical protein PRIPAC_35547 [Pristionchus pacificus]